MNLEHTSLKTRVVVGGTRPGWIDWGQLYEQVTLMGVYGLNFIYIRVFCSTINMAHNKYKNAPLKTPR